MSDKLDYKQYMRDGEILDKGEKLGTHKLNPRDVPFYDISYCREGVDPSIADAVIKSWPVRKITVKRNLLSDDSKTNAAEKHLPLIRSFTHNAAALVELRCRLQNEVFEFDDPSSLDPLNVYGRMSTFQSCLTDTALTQFQSMVFKCQQDTITTYETDTAKCT